MRIYLLGSLALILVLAACVAQGQSSKDKLRATVNSDGSTRKKLPVRIGPDGRPLLFGPKINECKKSKRESKFNQPHTSLFMTL